MGKREEIRAKRRKQQVRQRILIILMIVGGALLISAAMILPTLQPVTDIATVTPFTTSARVDKNTLGDPNALVKVDVWEDFQCPACQRYTQEVESLVIQNYVETGKVFYTFHNYPFIDSQVVTKESHQAANASMCAAEQGYFWDYHALLFANWNGENQGAFTDARLIAFAKNLKLNMSDFKACFNANRYSTQIEQDFQAGQTAGVTGTPSVFVNGVLIMPGYIPTYEAISQAIEAALAGH